MEKRSISLSSLPVLFGFFVMGFCDIVGISSDYAAAAFGWSGTMAGLVPSMVFVWFFFLGIPASLLMNRIGRKTTVLLSYLITVAGMALPIISYSSATTLAAYAMLGIGNAILQVSLNPLLSNVMTDPRLLTSSLTAGQVVKALSSFAGPSLVLLAINVFGGGYDRQWYLCFPIMGGITLLSGLWLLATPIPREAAAGSGTRLGDCLRLLIPSAESGAAIPLLFFGIFFAVATDVSTNFISSKVMISRFGYSREMAGIAPQTYFVLRTAGAFIGVLAMTRISASRYFRWNIVACLASVLVLAFVHNDIIDLLAIGAIGFFCACVFPIVYGMAVKTLPEKTNEISGLMIMAVAGGTVSFLVGAANDAIGITGGILVILLEVAYLAFCAFRFRQASAAQ
ncbi:MAG: MFS transporter [Prevotella sp.]